MLNTIALAAFVAAVPTDVLDSLTAAELIQYYRHNTGEYFVSEGLMGIIVEDELIRRRVAVRRENNVTVANNFVLVD